MGSFFRTFAAEGLKLRQTALSRLVWLLPILFLAVAFLAFDRPLLALDPLPPTLQATAGTLHLKLLVALWGGFFHPLALALIPALLFRPEHRFRTWRHLHAQPVSRRAHFLAKALWALLLLAAVLGLVGLLLLLERKVLGWVNPALALPARGSELARILGWLWLASLPVTALYLWIADRISSAAVPIVFGLVGLLLTMALTGQELPQPWRRDLIPWILPYAAAEQQVRSATRQQEAHLAAALFQPEPDVLRLPSGRKIKTRQSAPDWVVFPPRRRRRPG